MCENLTYPQLMAILIQSYLESLDWIWDGVWTQHTGGCIVELHLSARWLSRSPIIQIGLALG